MLPLGVTAEELARGRFVPLSVTDDGELVVGSAVLSPPPPPPAGPTSTGGGGAAPERWEAIARELVVLVGGALIGIGALGLLRVARGALLR